MRPLNEPMEVVLTIRQPKAGLEPGARGRIVMVYDSTPPGIYEVEFDLEYEDRAQRLTCSGEELRLV
ncbi:MAG: hypothetical protein PVF49_04325 [Anaerolineales bacterium]